MKIIPLILSTFLFMQCTTTNNVAEINWSVADSLPKTITRQTQLGVAGPVVGIHHNHLLIAGGANFPEKMPWDEDEEHRDDMHFRPEEKQPPIGLDYT